MRVAVCMSGQPRTWETCYESWRQLLKGYDVDFFCYMWDYNSLPQHVNMSDELCDISVGKEEQKRFIEAVNPKRIIFEPKKSFPIHNDGVKKPLMPFEGIRSQYYGLWQASLLKRAFEIENNIEYDIVLRIRPDTYFPKHVNVIQSIKPSTIYLQQYHDISKFYGVSPDQLVFTDVFFMADSSTFDKFAQLYCALSYLEEDDIFPPEYGRPNHVTPEWIVGYFAVHQNISIEILKHFLLFIRRGKNYPGQLRRGEIF